MERNVSFDLRNYEVTIRVLIYVITYGACTERFTSTWAKAGALIRVSVDTLVEFKMLQKYEELHIYSRK
jgi:hypothetical protein